MIFKPKVKQKLKKFWVRAPIITALALACLISVPTRADAADSRTTLTPTMDHFVKIGNYDIIETTGKTLNEMFDIKAHNKSELNHDRQYIAYFKIDRKKTGTMGWHTEYEYWHTKPWNSNQYYNGKPIPNVPTSNVAAKQRSDYIFGYQVNTSKTSKAVSNTGKKTFYHFKKNLDDKSKDSVGNGMIGTLHYFCIDEDTVTGQRFAKVMSEHPERDYVEFYISPVIQRSDGHYYYDCKSWYSYGWSDRNYNNYYVHYNQLVRFKLPQVKVNSTCYNIGKQKTGKSDIKYQVRKNVKSNDKDYVRTVKTADYIWGPQSEILTNSKGKKYQTTEHRPFSEKSYTIKNPASQKNGKFLIKTNKKTGKKQKFMCVGFRVTKVLDKASGGDTIVLASSMIELTKGASGDYVPYFVSDKDKETTQTDKVDGEDISAPPSKIYDQKVTVKRFNKYKSTKNGACTPVTTFKTGEVITVAKWNREINQAINWCNSTNWGIRNEDKDTTSKINVDWFYAAIGDSSFHTVKLETYYTTESFNKETKEYPSVDDSKDLEYKHSEKTDKSVYRGTKVLAGDVQDGAPWVSYSVKTNANGAYVKKDGTVVPESSDKDGSTAEIDSHAKSRFEDRKPVKQVSKSDLTEIKDKNTGMSTASIPYVIKTSDKQSLRESCENYLYRIVITTTKDSEWTQFTAADIWGSHTPVNGAIHKSKSTNRSYVTYAPYMRNYVYTKYGTPGQIKAKTSDWQKDAYDMTHFIIPEVRSDVIIKAYYTTTVPVRIYTYVKDNGDWQLDESTVEKHWISPGVTYHGTYDISKYVAAIMACTGRKANCLPYTTEDIRKTSFKSVSSAEKFYSDRTNLAAEEGTYSVKIKAQPVVICIFIDNSDGKYFTQVQYVHTQDGKYHLVKSWRQPIRTLTSEPVNEYLDDTCHPTKYGCYHTGHNYTHYSSTTRAFVSFPHYVSWDEGPKYATGLYGSLYKDYLVTYEYNKNPKIAKTRTTVPGSLSGSNNSEIYLTKTGDLVLRQTGSKAKADNADRTPGGNNSLVVYCMYDDIFNNWHNEQYNPTKDKGSDDPLTETEVSIYWNWLLPNGFVWEHQDIESKDTVDETQYDDSYTNPYIASVFGTKRSAVFDAQSGIPTTDKVRTVSQIPRYLTKGYWNKKMLDYAYRVYAVYVSQHKSSQKIVESNDPSCWPPGKGYHDFTDLGTYSYGTKTTVKCDFDYYTSEVVQQSQNLVVERHSVYYTLGDAEVWDPVKVTLKNDVYTTEGSNNICKNHLITLFPNGVDGSFQSNARFFKTGDGAYRMPDLAVKRQYVNYGTYNDWEDSGSPDQDLDNFQTDAESIVGKFKVKNDTVSFYNGCGETFVLSDGSMDLQEMVDIPTFPPEAEQTVAGLFDSANTTPNGITVEPYTNNGHHETCSIAYYKQIQVIPTNKYYTQEMIKTKIADDGDDDVEVYTPTVNRSQINLDYNNKGTNSTGDPLYPIYDWDQAVDHSQEQSLHNIQLDREYTMTISVEDDASDMDGYGYQNYVRYLALDKYGMPYTQVKFPFPVQMVVKTVQNGNMHTDDRYYYANTWISLEMIDDNGNINGTINQTFFVPSWATEMESATIRFRSIALNADENPDSTRTKSDRPNNQPGFKGNDTGRIFENEYTNDALIDDKLTDSVKERYNAQNERDYVAWMEETDTVTGRISSFQITDVTDYPAWQPVFRKYDKDSKKYLSTLTGNAYYSGVSNEFGFLGPWGSLYTAPVFGSSNPAGKSVGTLGLGYKIRYKMTIVGPYYNLTDKVSFKPTFYFVNDKGEYLQQDGSFSSNINTRAQVNVYYSETVNNTRQTLIKVGSKQDKLNTKSLCLADDEWDVNKSLRDFTNDTLHTSNVGKKQKQYTFEETNLTSAMRIINGNTHQSAHLGQPLSLESDKKFEFNSKMYNILQAVSDDPQAYVGTDYETLTSELSMDQVAKSVQTWYGEYYLPSDVYVTQKSWDTVKSQIKNGFEGSEDCWLKGGHLVINFNPQISSDTHQMLRYSVEQRYPIKTDKETKYVKGGCNQFSNENCVTSKMTTTGEVIPLDTGDVLVYDFAGGLNAPSTGKAPSAKDAYDSSGSH